MNKLKKVMMAACLMACMSVPTMASFAGQWVDCGAVWQYYTDDGQYRGWMDEGSGAKYFLNQYGDMAVGYQPLVADEQNTITWHYFTEAEGENADAFLNHPTYGKVLTGYQNVHGVNVYFSENPAENGKLFVNTATPDGRVANSAGVLG